MLEFEMNAEADTSIDDLAQSLAVDREDLVGGLNLPEAARLLGIAVSTLRERALVGAIGCQRDGRRWIFSWEDLAQYLERRRCSVRCGDYSVRPGEERRRSVKSRGRREKEDVEREARRLGLI